jgi:hypothetical protein
MTWMGHEADEPKNLTPEQKEKLAKIADTLELLATKLTEPVDPKVEAMLRMAADMLNEQVQLDKYYPWECECGEDSELLVKNYEMDQAADEESNLMYRYLDQDDNIKEGSTASLLEEVKPKEESDSVTPSAEQLQNWLTDGAAPKDDEDDDV